MEATLIFDKIDELKRLSERLVKTKEIYSALNKSKTIRLEIIEPLGNVGIQNCPRGYRLDEGLIECMKEFFQQEIGTIWELIQVITQPEDSTPDVGEGDGELPDGELPGEELPGEEPPSGGLPDEGTPDEGAPDEGTSGEGIPDEGGSDEGGSNEGGSGEGVSDEEFPSDDLPGGSTELEDCPF